MKPTLKAELDRVCHEAMSCRDELHAYYGAPDRKSMFEIESNTGEILQSICKELVSVKSHKFKLYTDDDKMDYITHVYTAFTNIRRSDIMLTHRDEEKHHELYHMLNEVIEDYMELSAQKILDDVASDKKETTDKTGNSKEDDKIKPLKLTMQKMINGEVKTIYPSTLPSLIKWDEEGTDNLIPMKTVDGGMEAVKTIKWFITAQFVINCLLVIALIAVAFL